jgi:hypothetical protein
MSRPKKEVVGIDPTAIPESNEQSSKKIYAKVVHLAVGVDLLGSKTSLVAKKGNTLEVTPLGILAVSGNNGRKLLIPFPNVKAAELE